MFGFLYGLITLLSSGYEHGRRWKDEHDSKKHWEEEYIKGNNRKQVYFDWQGHERDLFTGKKVFFYYEHGHYFKKEVGGKVLEDLTESNKKAETRLRLREAEDAAVYMYCNDIKKKWNLVYGSKTNPWVHKGINAPLAVYVLKSTGQYCLLERINFGNQYLQKIMKQVPLVENACDRSYDCYVDIHTGELLCLSAKAKPMSIDETTGKLVPMKEEDIQKGIEEYNKYVKQGLVTDTEVGNPFNVLFEGRFV